MINKQQSLPSESMIQIFITQIISSSMNKTFLPLNENYKKINSQTIVVKSNDFISTIYDTLDIQIKYAKFIFNGQILCPNLSFTFYNIHNKDNIDVITPETTNSTQIKNALSNIPLKDQTNHNILIAAPLPVYVSHKRTLFYSNSSCRFKNGLLNNKGHTHNNNEKCNINTKEQQNKNQFLNEPNTINNTSMNELQSKNFIKDSFKYSGIPSIFTEVIKKFFCL